MCSAEGLTGLEICKPCNGFDVSQDPAWTKAVCNHSCMLLILHFAVEMDDILSGLRHCMDLLMASLQSRDVVCDVPAVWL